MTNEIISEVLVFKTNIVSADDLEKIAVYFDNNRLVRKWNVDRADIDNVLRVESEHLLPVDVVKLVSSIGFFCEELPD